MDKLRLELNAVVVSNGSFCSISYWIELVVLQYSGGALYGGGSVPNCEWVSEIDQKSSSRRMYTM